jgi:mono/diheme cytochrome c family protein
MSSILDGTGRYMPAWKGILSQSDVEALVSYIRLLSF